MPLEVHWSRLARRDLVRILEYCGQRDPDWAIAVDEAIATKLEFLSEFPYLSDPLPPTSRGERREALAGDYRIVFSVNEDEQRLYVISLRHVRQADPDFSE